MAMANEPQGFPVTDPRRIAVHCRMKNWMDHEKIHPEIVGRSSDAADTIRQPLAIYRSHQKPTRDVYYRPLRFSGMSGLVYLRVITDVDNNGVHWFVSAFAVTGPDAREVLIWS